MRTFENFPEDELCPVCGKNENRPCVLVPIDGTASGKNCRAAIVHADCITSMIDEGGLKFNKELGIFY